MNHSASRGFWHCYDALPANIQELADKNFALLQADPTHPSLHFKKVGRFRSARVGLQHRTLAWKWKRVCSGSGLGTTQIMSG